MIVELVLCQVAALGKLSEAAHNAANKGLYLFMRIHMVSELSDTL